MEVIAHGNIFHAQIPDTVHNRPEASGRASLQGKALLKVPRLIFAIQATTLLQTIDLPATQKHRGHTYLQIHKYRAWTPASLKLQHGLQRAKNVVAGNYTYYLIVLVYYR